VKTSPQHRTAAADLARALMTALPLGDYFGPEALAKQLGQSVSWVLSAIESGEIPARRVLGTWLISKDALNERFREGARALEQRNGGGS